MLLSNVATSHTSAITRRGEGKTVRQLHLKPDDDGLAAGAITGPMGFHRFDRVVRENLLSHNLPKIGHGDWLQLNR